MQATCVWINRVIVAKSAFGESCLAGLLCDSRRPVHRICVDRLAGFKRLSSDFRSEYEVLIMDIRLATGLVNYRRRILGEGVLLAHQMGLVPTVSFIPSHLQSQLHSFSMHPRFTMEFLAKWFMAEWPQFLHLPIGSDS
jgi:hypothetical protein